MARFEAEGVTFASVVYRPEPGLDLFVFTLSDKRRLSVPRENLQALNKSTAETAAVFAIGPFREDVRWTALDEGITLDDLLEGRYGSNAWMEQLDSRTPLAA